MTAREMLTFVFYFPLIIGDLIHEKDKVWLFVLNIMDLIDIVFKNEFSKILQSWHVCF